MSMLTVKYPETVSVIATPVTEIYGSDGTVIAKAKLFYTPERNDFNFEQTEELTTAGIAMHPYGAMLMPADATEPDYSKLVAHIKGEEYEVDTVADNVITFKKSGSETETISIPFSLNCNLAAGEYPAESVYFKLVGLDSEMNPVFDSGTSFTQTTTAPLNITIDLNKIEIDGTVIASIKFDDAIDMNLSTIPSGVNNDGVSALLILIESTDPEELYNGDEIDVVLEGHK